MSDYEIHKGKLIQTEMTKEEVVKEWLSEYSGDSIWFLEFKEKSEINKDDIEEIFCDIEEYIEINGKLYKIEDEYFQDDDDLFKMKENTDGSIDYFVRFYNGGCGFEEALELAAEKIVI